MQFLFRSSDGSIETRIVERGTYWSQEDEEAGSDRDEGEILQFDVCVPKAASQGDAKTGACFKKLRFMIFA
jgi:hypothetical protein